MSGGRLAEDSLRVRSGVAPGRVCAYRVIRRVFERGAYADRALRAEADRAGLDPRDRALAMHLSYGAVQRRETLDHLIERLARRPTRQLTPAVLAALRLGLFQLLFMDAVPSHAVVSDSVELAKDGGAPGSRLVNAVLRRSPDDAAALLAALVDDTPQGAAVLHSVPGWLAELWWRELGEHEARALLRRINQPAESALRVNTLLTTREEVLRQLPVPARPAAELPEGLVLDGPFDVQGSELWRRGAVMAQSRGSMRVARMLAPLAGERILDLCAAPGAKTTQLAALAAGQSEIVAVERHPGRAAALERTCARMGASAVRVEVADARRPCARGGFERVLLDPPCSGLGTLQSRPDIRWRASPSSISELAAAQRQMLEQAAQATAPGGMLVYSVCTISRAEGSGLIEDFLDADDRFAAEQLLQLLPHRDFTDGFFIAKLRRSGARRGARQSSVARRVRR